VIEARRSAAWDRTVMRWSGFARGLTGRHLALAAILAAVAIVWIVGLVQPGNSQPAATSVGSDWGAGGAVGGLNVFDLATKGGLVLILLFGTLKVLGRAQGSAAKTSSSRLVVLESRSLASKASLHLVAVGGRRLVIGLTPSGMVSLAELDATEFHDPEAEAGAVSAEESTGALPADRTARPALDSMLAPLDRVGAQLYKLVSGGRVR
jgi:flagellar biogenesis protein FliO